MDVLANDLSGSDSKITPATVKEELVIVDEDECSTVDQISILQPVLLKQLPLERISGVINLYYALYGNGTETDLENALVRLLQKKITNPLSLSLL